MQPMLTEAGHQSDTGEEVAVPSKPFNSLANKRHTTSDQDWDIVLQRGQSVTNVMITKTKDSRTIGN
jgi:hypothetical protein